MHTLLKRLAVGLGLLLLMALPGCDRDSPSGTKPRAAAAPKAVSVALPDDTPQVLKIGMPGKDIKIACIVIARQLGYYADEGLDVRFEPISNLSEGLTAVTMGKLDVLPFGVIPSATFVSQGSDVVVFGGTIAEGSELVVKPENLGSFQKPEDFIGKKVGCYRMETGHMVTKGWLREHGIDIRKDVEFILLDSQQTIIEAVRKGAVDVGFLNSGQGYVAIQAGLAVEGHVGDFVADFPCCRQTTSRAAFNEKRAALVKFQRANLRAYQVFLTDRETALNALVAHSGQPRNFVQAIMYGLDEYKPAMSISLDPDKTKVVAFYEVMRANGDIPSDTPYAMADHVDTGIYEEALNSLLEKEPDNPVWVRLMEEYTVNN